MPPYMDAHSNAGCYDDPPSPPSARGPLHNRVRGATKSSKRGGETRGEELLRLASAELEAMRSPSSSPISHRTGKAPATRSPASPTPGDEPERPFPPACLALLRSSVPSSSRCHECSSSSEFATWASVSHGVTLCLQCSGRHRGLGVGTSKVKSLALDSWNRREIICMLEGGNEQLTGFFERHGMGGSKGGELARYRTRAASFYRQHLLGHARRLAEGGPYEGREASRARAGKGEKKGSGRSKSRRKTSEAGRDPRLSPVMETESDAKLDRSAVGA